MGEKALNTKKPEAHRENQIPQRQKTNDMQHAGSPVDRIMFLQRTAGNRAVQRLFKSEALQAKLSQPGDIYEEEADRIASAVVDTGVIEEKSTTSSPVTVQREEKKQSPASGEEKLKEGLKKAGEAFLETDVGKKLKEQASELGKDFISSLEGKIITGTAAAGALAGIFAANAELPMQIPEIPLDALAPGLKMKLTYEGPVQKPTAASITFTFTPGAGSQKKPAMTEAEKFRAETARMAAEQARFREGLKTPEQRAAEDAAFWRAYWGGMDRFGLRPLAGAAKQPRPDDKTLQRKEQDGAKSTSGVPPVVDRVLEAGSGRPLGAPMRAFMESRFRHDFSNVRMHTDAKAGEAARSVNARAFTVGKDVVFGTGEYMPDTSAGQRLLAHELAHVVQQRTHTVSLASEQILQRAVKYIEEVTGDEAEPYLQTFDRTVETIDKQISSTAEPVADELRAALAQLRSLRTNNKITCWRVSGGLTYASYDNATGQIRLHINIGSAASSPVSLIHEAIHALHASRYPGLSRMYADVLAAGGTANESIGVLLLKWKAWTEYWAYRRHVEFGNLSQPPEFRRDPDLTARRERDVVASIAKVRELTGENFNPSSWTPPAKYRAKPGGK